MTDFAQENFHSAEKAAHVQGVLERGSVGDKKFSLNKGYLTPTKGYTRIGLIAMLILGTISALAVCSNYAAFSDDQSSKVLQGAYLFFSVGGCFFSIVIFFYNLVHIKFLEKLNKIPWDIIWSISDTIFSIGIMTTSIMCIAREATLQSNGYPSFINKGAFTAAAVFGFLACVLYAVSSLLWVIQSIKARKVRQPSATST